MFYDNDCPFQGSEKIRSLSDLSIVNRTSHLEQLNLAALIPYV